MQKGDTLYSIARRFSTTVQDLKRLNNLTSDTLSIGTRLIINEIIDTPTNTYIVQRGDTLYSIANKFNITIQELKRINNLSTDILAIGQQLLISNKALEDSINTEIYVVQKGDSLWSISQAFSTTVDELIKLNNLNNINLQIGDQLLVPTQPTPEVTTYIVQSGDTLWSIARANNTTVDKIKQINNLTSNLLSVGQQLILA